MRTFVEAATGLPTILFTSALVVVVCFWLLVAVGITEAASFDEDVDLDGWGLGGVPVAVAFSLLTVVTWALSIGATILVAALVPSGVVAGVLRLTVPAGALVAAWWLTRLSTRLLHRLFSDESESSRAANSIGGDLTGSAHGLCDEADEPPACNGPYLRGCLARATVPPDSRRHVRRPYPSGAGHPKGRHAVGRKEP